MILIEEFIKLARETRREHLMLEESCCERGGNSTNHKGVLAQYLNTTIPSGRILLCHACHNAKCSNPRHLYWGTDKDNHIDSADNGTWVSPWDRQVEKYGYDEACKMNSRKMIGNVNGSANSGKSKSEEHKKNIAKSVSENYRAGLVKTKGEGAKPSGRKRKMPYSELVSLVNQFGLPKTAEMLNESYQNVRSRFYTAKKVVDKESK